MTLINFVFLYHGRIRIIARRSISIEEIEAQKEVVSKAKDRYEAELEKLEKLMMNKQYSMKIYPAGRGRDVYRNIEICGNSTLNQLCEVIPETFDFMDEHLYEFCMDNRKYSRGGTEIRN